MEKLSMPIGLLLEAAISGGVTGMRLIEVLRNRNLNALKHIGKEEDSWKTLFLYTEENENIIMDAVHNGYTYKFITIRGLQNLIQTRFSFKENQNFMMDEKGINLYLEKEQLSFLQSRVPSQWHFIKQNKDMKWNYRAVLAQPQIIEC